MKTRLSCLFGGAIIWMMIGGSAIGDSRTEGLRQKAQTLDMQCRRSLGIGLLDLSLLAQARSGSLLLESDLQRHHRLESLETLSKLGLVTISRSNSGQEVWIEMLPTDDGKAILSGVSSKDGYPSDAK